MTSKYIPSLSTTSTSEGAPPVSRPRLPLYSPWPSPRATYTSAPRLPDGYDSPGISVSGPYTFDELHKNTRLLQEIANNWEYIRNSLGDEVMHRLNSFGDSDPISSWKKIAPFVNSDSSIAADFIAYWREESRPLDANSLSAIERVDGGSVLLAESCKRCFELGAADQDRTAFDSVAARVTASRMIGRRFSSDTIMRDILEHAASNGDVEALIGLSIGWPESDTLRSAYSAYKSRNGMRFSWPALIHVCARVSSEREFVEILGRLVSQADGNV